MRRRTREWLDRKRLRVTVAGEFDDAALMAAFGRERVGAFPVPSVLLDDYLAAGDLVLLGTPTAPASSISRCRRVGG